MIPKAVQEWLEENGYGGVTRRQAVSGGCINSGAVLETGSGQRFFLKTNTSNPADMFEREAQGLEALDVKNGPRLPRSYLFGSDFLLLEDLKPAPKQDGYWSHFGRQLAALHNHTHEQFGFCDDNYIGSTPQPNPWTPDGYEFFGEWRLLFQAKLARRRNALRSKELIQVDRLVGKLPELAPLQPASLIHGDLWSGNAMTDAKGAPAIIDPAAHYGWAEAELAMTDLFGSFPETFYRAYQEERPLEAGFRQRYPIYNLYHLLNHLNLFGGGYQVQVKAILDRYA